MVGLNKLWFGNTDNKPVEVFLMGQDVNITNIATISGLSMEQILNKMVEKKIGIDLGSSGESGSSVVEGRLFPGEKVKFDGMYWVVAHCDYIKKVAYLSSEIVLSMTQFGSNNTYRGSTLANLTAQFEASMSPAALNRAVNTTVNGVTSKLFIPSYEQYNGGFSYFATQANRVCKDAGGTAQWYWTSSPNSSGDVWGVNYGGSLSYGDYPSNAGGFRPCVAISL